MTFSGRAEHLCPSVFLNKIRERKGNWLRLEQMAAMQRPQNVVQGRK
jgi:hypothetical protein